MKETYWVRVSPPVRWVNTEVRVNVDHGRLRPVLLLISYPVENAGQALCRRGIVFIQVTKLGNRCNHLHLQCLLTSQHSLWQKSQPDQNQMLTDGFCLVLTGVVDAIDLWWWRWWRGDRSALCSLPPLNLWVFFWLIPSWSFDSDLRSTELLWSGETGFEPFIVLTFSRSRETPLWESPWKNIRSSIDQK